MARGVERVHGRLQRSPFAMEPDADFDIHHC